MAGVRRIPSKAIVDVSSCRTSIISRLRELACSGTASAIAHYLRAHRRLRQAPLLVAERRRLSFCEEEVEMNELTGLLIGIAPVLTALAW